MSRVFITGSADGLGQMAARQLVEDGHQVLLHGRDEGRAAEAVAQVPGAAGAVSGNLASLEETRLLAAAVNERGPFDAVIHNAGVGYREPRRILTEDGLAHVFQINALAPYLLSALIERPERLVYLSSGWAARERRTTSTRPPTLRSGSRSTLPPRPSAAATSTTSNLPNSTPPPPTPSCRTASSTSARS